MDVAASRTALVAAVARGALRLEAWPWVLDDSLALVLVGAAWPDLYDRLRDDLTPPVLKQACAFVGVRSRYAEDRLVEGEFGQYVLLGAGLDSLAWRRPDLLESVTIFEVDHPASQAWKLQRIEYLSLPKSDAHVFVPVDFERQSFRDGLDVSGFDWKRRTLFAWLGVMPYLSADAIEATLRVIASAGLGSEVIFDYRCEDSLLDDIGRRFIDEFTSMAAESGEPVQPGWSATQVERLLVRCGLKVRDHPTRQDLIDRYFGSRADGLMPYTTEGLVAASVG